MELNFTRISRGALRSVYAFEELRRGLHSICQRVCRPHHPTNPNVFTQFAKRAIVRRSSSCRRSEFQSYSLRHFRFSAIALLSVFIGCVQCMHAVSTTTRKHSHSFIPFNGKRAAFRSMVTMHT